MIEKQPLDRGGDKLLFTPGPLTTSRTVKLAMLRDLGSRDIEFIGVVRSIRRKLLELGGVEGQGYEAIPMQGSGTFALESVVSSAVPPDGKMLVAINGAYGHRIEQIARALQVGVVPLITPETQAPDPNAVAVALERDSAITHVALVHCETTTGIFNPVREVGEAARRFHRRYLVDAMSSFGAVPLNLADCSIDYMVSSANKCVEGVPGFAFVLARREALLESEGFARSFSLDLVAQWKGLERDGQFRFTPPTHALLALQQALIELEQEGGVEGRAARYRENYRTLLAGMRELGFEEYLEAGNQGYIITSFRYPDHANFRFDEFYSRLNEKGYVIYPGKVSVGKCFRIGHIGRIFPSDMRNLLAAIGATLGEMGIELSRKSETCPALS
jgi:2-aminoethylphosphonate-pyruvate transaminase